MQWLIDLVIESIGVPPVFIDRGDPASDDFAVIALTRNGAWHNLDLSGIVPSNASAVAMVAWLGSPVINRWFELRKKGNINNFNENYLITQVANIATAGNFVVPIGTDGLLEYKFQDGTFNQGAITVKGWWL